MFDLFCPTCGIVITEKRQRIGRRIQAVVAILEESPEPMDCKALALALSERGEMVKWGNLRQNLLQFIRQHPGGGLVTDVKKRVQYFGVKRHVKERD